MGNRYTNKNIRNETKSAFPMISLKLNIETCMLKIETTKNIAKQHVQTLKSSSINMEMGQKGSTSNSLKPAYNSHYYQVQWASKRVAYNFAHD